MSVAKLILASAVIVAVSQAHCGNGWHPNPFGTCYKFSSDAKTWAAAKRTCEQYGGYLVMFESMSEIVYMKGLRHHLNLLSEGYLTAGTDAGQEGNWVWRTKDGDYPMLATDWHSGEPSDHVGQENCLELTPYRSYNGNYGADLNFNDDRCDAEIGYICEKPDH